MFHLKLIGESTRQTGPPILRLDDLKQLLEGIVSDRPGGAIDRQDMDQELDVFLVFSTARRTPQSRSKRVAQGVCLPLGRLRYDIVVCGLHDPDHVGMIFGKSLFHEASSTNRVRVMGSQGTWYRQAKYARGSAVIIHAANRFILIDCVC